MTRVLVVDDDAPALAGLRMLLELDGFDVVTVDSSRAAIVLLGSQRFDAVVTDLEMPIVSGIEVVRSARAARSDACVFVVTGHGYSSGAVAAKALGARRVFGKPLDYDALVAELKSLTLSVR